MSQYDENGWKIIEQPKLPEQTEVVEKPPTADQIAQAVMDKASKVFWNIAILYAILKTAEFLFKVVF